MIHRTSLFLGRCLALAALVLLAPACLIHKPERTPAGWKVKWEEQGTITTGLHTRLEVFQLFDAAMDRAVVECATLLSLDPGYVHHRIKDDDATYTLVDNFYFPIIGGMAAVDAPDAQFASGETLDRVEVWVAFYSKAGPALPADVPTNAPPWTLRASTTYPGQNWWGTEIQGQQYPALWYELHWQFTNNP
jgi:hypothetical protein